MTIEQMTSVIMRPTTVCSRLATARFFKGFAPAKVLYNEVGLAGPAAGEAEGWTDKTY